jgi:hypothetical protein
MDLGGPAYAMAPSTPKKKEKKVKKKITKVKTKNLASGPTNKFF